MLYIAQLLEEDKLQKIVNEYTVGLEVISFSIGYVLDQVDKYIACYQESFKVFEDTMPMTFHGPFLDLMPGSCDQRVIALATERYEACYKAARVFGVQKIIFHTGYIPHTYPDTYWVQNMVSFWKHFLKGKDKEMTFYIENVLDTTPYLIKQIIEEVGAPNLQVCLDLGHVHMYANDNVMEWIEVLKGKIGHVHIHNNDQTRDAHRGILDGTLPMQEVLTALRRYAPTADWCLEISNEEALEQSLRWLNKEY